MGVIYLAHDPSIGRPVAIKLVRTDLLDGLDHEQYLARFQAEARNAGRCMHANVVAIYDFALHEGNPYIAMEYVDGVALSEILKRSGRFTPPDAVALISQVLAALGAAHQLGVVHRDVKPANILVLPDGRVKMTDFGISRINTSNMTMDGSVIGTPAYMSPEQCRGETVDHRSDLFSAGTVLYELLCGARAFSGRNASEVSYRLLHAEPPDLSEQISGLPGPLASALRRAMEKERDARFGSARKMADALEEAMRAQPDSRNEGTVINSIRPPPAVADGQIDDAVLATIERRLARHLGPIARHLVRNAAKQSSSIGALCDTLATAITDPAERERFTTETRAGNLGTGGTAAGPVASQAIPAGTGAPTRLSQDQIARAEQALTRVIGPIAKVLVKRTLSAAGSEEELWTLLARHIENPADRDLFTRSHRPA